MNEIVFDDCGIAGITFSELSPRSLIDGDIDIDGDSAGFDFLEWQRGASSDPLTASGLVEWETSHGTARLLSALANVSAVPEPSIWSVLGCVRRRPVTCRPFRYHS